MSCISFTNLCPASGDPEAVLLAKILQSLNEGSGGGGGGGVTAIKVNGGANQTGVVSLTIPQNTDELPEGSTNLYFTEARVLATDLAGFASALGAITAADTVLSAFGKTQGRLAALEAGTAGPFLLRAGDTGTGAFLFTPSVNDVVPLTLTTAAGSANTSNNLVVNYGAANLMSLRNDGRLVLNGRHASVTTSVLGHGFRVSDVNTATAVAVLTIGHNLSAGVGAAGIGSFLDWNLDSSTTPDTRAARWETTWTNAAHATRTAQTRFLAFTAGVEASQMTLTGAQVLGPDGAIGTPSFAFINDADTGMWRNSSNAISLSTGGQERMRLIGGVVNINQELTFCATIGTAETKVVSEAANTLSMRNSTNAQTMRWYGTFTDASNYSRTTVITQAGNHMLRTEAAGTGLTAGAPRTLQVGTGPSTGTDIAGASGIFHSGQSTGTGVRGAILFQQSAPAGGTGSGVNALTTTWQISTIGTIQPGTDNTFDIGVAGTARIKSIHAGTDVFIGAGRFFRWASSSLISSPSDGVISLLDTTLLAFNRLQFGGTTNSANAIGRDAVNGFTIQSAAATATYNDASTAASGTVADRYLFGIATPTLTSTNATVTYTRASTLFLGGAPVASTNVTIGTTFALQIATGDIGLLSANNIVLDATTGTKIGTSTSQKLGFYNATPITQGASVADATGGAIIDAEARTAINALISRIEALGLIATV